MATSLDLQDLEERTFRSRFDDGLLDLIVGLFVLAFGLSLGTSYGGLGGVWAAMLISLWYPLRRSITEPRMGYVEFSKPRQARMRRSMTWMGLALGLSVLAGVGMWVVFAIQDPAFADALRPLGPIPFGVMLGLLLAVGAKLLGIARGYVYAALVLACVTGAHLLGLEDDLRLALIVSGAVITSAGAWRLASFLRDNPRPPEDETLPPTDGSGAEV